MDINIAREVAARIWCDQEMSSVVMDVGLAEEIAQLLASRLTPDAADSCKACGQPLVGGICANKSCAKFVPLI